MLDNIVKAAEEDHPSLPSLSEILRDNPSYLDEAISPEDTSVFSNTPVPTLATMRCRGGGPAFLKRGSRVSYTRRALLEWMIAQRRISTSDPGPDPQPTEAAEPEGATPEHAPVGHNQPPHGTGKMEAEAAKARAAP